MIGHFSLHAQERHYCAVKENVFGKVKNQYPYLIFRQGLDWILNFTKMIQAYMICYYL